MEFDTEIFCMHIIHYGTGENKLKEENFSEKCINGL